LDLSIFKEYPKDMAMDSWVPYLAEVFRNVNQVIEKHCQNVLSLFGVKYTPVTYEISHQDLISWINGIDYNSKEKISSLLKSPLLIYSEPGESTKCLDWEALFYTEENDSGCKNIFPYIF
jgi:hypothetical protein